MDKNFDPLPAFVNFRPMFTGSFRLNWFAGYFSPAVLRRLR